MILLNMDMVVFLYLCILFVVLVILCGGVLIELFGVRCVFYVILVWCLGSDVLE